MRYNRVFFISYPVAELSNNTYPDPGIGYIIQNALKLGIEHDFIDNRLGYKFSYLNKRISDFKPDLIAIGMKMGQYLKQYEMFKEIKERFPKADILCGGDNVTVMREKVLKDCPVADYAIPFEGEMVFNALLRGDELETIKGLIYRKNNGVVFNGFQDVIEDLDSLEFPKFEKVDFPKYKLKEIGVVSSRGCPFACIFCIESTKGRMRRWRSRSPEKFVDEIEYWVKRGYNRFDFSEPCFNQSKERVIKICDEIERRGFPPLFISCQTGARADNMDEELIIRLKRIGFWFILYGVEGGNDKMLKIINKAEKTEQIENAVRLSIKHGIEVILTFIVGTPGETYHDVMDSINLARKYPIHSVSFNNLIPIPGSKVFNQIEKENQFIVPPEVYQNKPWRKVHYKPLFETPDMSLKERKMLLRKTRAVKREIIRKKLKRKMVNKFGRTSGEILSLMLANRPLVYVLSMLSDTNPERFYVGFSKKFLKGKFYGEI